MKEVWTYNWQGVIIDTNLVFNGFLEVKCKKINLRLHQLGNLHKNVLCDLANTVYKQTIVPLVDYADFLIEISQKKNITRLRIDKGYRRAFRCSCILLIILVSVLM